jgi:hypothetical protein
MGCMENTPLQHVLGINRGRFSDTTGTPRTFGLYNPNAFQRQLLDEHPEERARILRGKVWRQTKDGYEEVTFPPPEPSKFFP